MNGKGKKCRAKSKSPSSTSDTAKVKDKTKPYLNEMIQCLVCGGKASGLHYGVYSCEGCKGFFRRTQRLSLTYPACPSEPCDITVKSRNKCQYCRYQKCIKLGMSSGAVRMGRVPDAEKDKMIQEMAEAEAKSSTSSPCSVEEDDSEHNEFVERLAKCYRDCYLVNTEDEIQGFRKYCSDEFEVRLPFPLTMSALHEGTPSFSPAQLEGPPKKITKPMHVLRHITATMELGIHKSAKFIKNVEELRELDITDRLTLFKFACLELSMCFWANRVNPGGEMQFPEDNTCVRRNQWGTIRLANRDLIEAKKRFFKKYNGLHLTDSEKALLLLLIISAPDRDELKERSKVEVLQEKATTALEKEVHRNHQDDGSKVFPTTLSLLVILRELIPTHVQRIHKIKDTFDGTLPMEPTPLMKEVMANLL